MEKQRRKTSEESRGEQGVRASRELGQEAVRLIRVVVVVLPGGGDAEVDLPAGHQASFVLGQGGHWLITGLQQQQCVARKV